MGEGGEAAKKSSVEGERKLESNMCFCFLNMDYRLIFAE